MASPKNSEHKTKRVKQALAGAVIIALVLVLAVVFNGGITTPGSGAGPATSSASVSSSLMTSTTLMSVSTGSATLVGSVSTTSPLSVLIIKANVTVVGQPAGIPCGALRLPCPFPTNSSAISAALIRYDGTDYYVSYMRVNGIQYAIWYDNSTYYCVTPWVEWANACPEGAPPTTGGVAAAVVYGQVQGTDENGNTIPIPGATVTVTNAANSTIIATAVSDSNGDYSLSIASPTGGPLVAQPYIIRVYQSNWNNGTSASMLIYLFWGYEASSNFRNNLYLTNPSSISTTVQGTAET